VSGDRVSCRSLTGSQIELGTKVESLLKVLEEYPHFGGHPAPDRPHGKDWRCSLKGSQKTDDGTFPEFCGEEPCWRLGNSQVFQDTHPLPAEGKVRVKVAGRIVAESTRALRLEEKRYPPVYTC
jgi:hypothetical protein